MQPSTIITQTLPCAMNRLLPLILLSSLLQAATVTFQDNQAELTNPGMGWVFHYYDNSRTNYGSRTPYSDHLDNFPGLSQIYLRLPWSDIEPQEGIFNWTILDSPLQRFRKRGLKASFRISCSETGFPYATPQWVREAGAKGYFFTCGKGVQADGHFWEPDFGDSVFLTKLDRFLAKLAERYDGHPDVELIDIGSIGVWGEGHTWSSTQNHVPTDVIKKHIDLYRKHFRHTIILGQDDFLSRPGFLRPVWKPGLTVWTYDLVIPRSWYGRSFDIAAAIHGKRLYGDAPNGRAVLGTLHVASDGRLRYTQTLAWNDDLKLPAGCFAAARMTALDYDPVNRPHSLKLPVAFLSGRPAADTPTPAVLIIDHDNGAIMNHCALESEDDDLTDYMVANGLGFRDDSVMVQGPPRAYFHGKTAQKFWRTAPVYLESEHYGPSFKRHNWLDGNGLLQAVRDWHATYCGIHWWPQEFLARNRRLIHDINMIIGFRFLPQSVSFPDFIHPHKRFTVRMTWQNRGVAPAYQDYFPCLALKTADGDLAAVFVAESLNLRRLPGALDRQSPPASTEASFAIPHNLPSGTYKVYVSAGDRLGAPLLQLPLDNSDGENRYYCGELTVGGDYATVIENMTAKGNTAEIRLAWQIHLPQEGNIEPFIHLNDPNGSLAKADGGRFQTAVPNPCANVGAVPCVLTIPLPDNAPDGATYSLLCGLWRPARIGNADERLMPDRHRGDKRVLLGTVTRQNGAWVIRPAKN